MSFNVASTCRQHFWNVFYSYDVSSKIEPFYKGGKVQVSLCYLSKAFILLELKRVVAVWKGWLAGGGHASDKFKLDVLIAVRGDPNIFTFSLLPCPCVAPKLSRNNPDIRIYLTCLFLDVLQVSKNEKYIFCTCGSRVNVLEISTGKIVHSVEHVSPEQLLYCF